MIRHNTVNSSGALGTDLVDGLAGLGSANRHIIAVYYTPAMLDATDGSNYGFDISSRFYAYRNQDELIDVAAVQFATKLATDGSNILEMQKPIRIPLDLEIKVGESFQVGYFNGVAASSEITIEYEDRT